MEAVEPLGREHLESVTSVLVEAFGDYPVLRYLLANSGAPAKDSWALVRYWVTARALREEPIFGVFAGTELAAVAMVAYPQREPPPELAVLAERLWADLGEEAHGRYQAFGATVAPLLVERPRIHLDMIGVRAAFEGSGLGRRLLERVHRHSLEVAGSEGVSLHTESPDNVPLYEHFGYEITGRGRVAPDLETWALFRSNALRRRKGRERAPA